MCDKYITYSNTTYCYNQSVTKKHIHVDHLPIRGWQKALQWWAFECGQEPHKLIDI
jgi:hypothetical protein